MKKSTFTLNVVWLSIILLSMMSVQSMEQDNIPFGSIFFYAQRHELTEPIFIYPNHLNQWTSIFTKQDLLAAQKAEQHNENNGLTSLPPEILIGIFSYCLASNHDKVKSLEASIERFMKLSTTCKNFNRLLTFKTIGSFCKNYSPKIKNQALKKLMRTTNYLNYKTKRPPLCALIYADADANTKAALGTLLEKAVIYNDTQMVAILFEHHADPNIEDVIGYPLFFQAKTIEIAQLFIAKGINIQETSPFSAPTILWKTIEKEYPSELMALYLEKKANVTAVHPLDNSSLLHRLARQDNIFLNDINDFLKKGEILLNAMPKEMVNLLNKKGQTPLDVIQMEPKFKHFAKDSLITLFRQHGGKRAQELQKEAMMLLLHKDDHVG